MNFAFPLPVNTYRFKNLSTKSGLGFGGGGDFTAEIPPPHKTRIFHSIFVQNAWKFFWRKFAAFLEIRYAWHFFFISHKWNFDKNNKTQKKNWLTFRPEFVFGKSWYNIYKNMDVFFQVLFTPLYVGTATKIFFLQFTSFLPNCFKN